MKLWIPAITLFILTLSSVSWALQLRLPDRAFQGDLIVGKVEPVGTVLLKGKEQPVSSRGYFVLGVPRLQKTDLLISAISGNHKVSKTVRVLAYKWNVQRIDGLPKRHVNPPPEALVRIKNDNQKVREIRQSGIHPTPLFLNDNHTASAYSCVFSMSYLFVACVTPVLAVKLILGC